MNFEPKTVLTVAIDPGAKNELAALCEEIRDRAPETVFLSITETQDATAIEKLFGERQIDYVFAGTSATNKTEHLCFQAASRHGIPSFGLIDHWVNLAARFKRDGRMILPDYILVNDSAAYELGVREGLPPEKLIIFGNPFYTHLEEFYEQQRQSAKRLGKTSGKHIAFISDNLTESGEPSTEVELFTVLLEELTKYPEPVKLTLCLHPKEQLEKWKPALAKSSLSIEVSQGRPLPEVFSTATHVVGLHSAAVLEASLAGIAPLVLATNDKLPVNNSLLWSRITQSSELSSVLADYLNATPQSSNGPIIAPLFRKYLDRLFSGGLTLKSRRVVGIIQARASSTRLPNKVFADIAGRPLIEHVVARARSASLITELVIATTTNPNDDAIANWANSNSVHVFRGDENNVLHRFAEAARSIGLQDDDIVVRITADDPLKDGEVTDRVIRGLTRFGVDFTFNNNPPSFPEGLDVEVFWAGALYDADENSSDTFEREHVTQYFYRRPQDFSRHNVAFERDVSSLRWTIDTIDDLNMTREVYNALYRPDSPPFTYTEALGWIETHPEIAAMNSQVARSAMYKK